MCVCVCVCVRPCTSGELLNNIVKVCRNDYSAIALTQEILVFLAMFIRSEPELFDEMLRLRVGLIRNVMVLELSRTMNVSCGLLFVRVCICVVCVCVCCMCLCGECFLSYSMTCVNRGDSES